MEGFIKIYGKTRRSLDEGWQKVVCFVSYSNPHDHRKIVEDSFQYHLSLDLDYINQNHPDHFTEPHNVGLPYCYIIISEIDISFLMTIILNI